MATGSAETNIGQTGGSGGSGVVGWRDAYTTLGAAEIKALNPSDFLNNFGAATSSATSGAVTVGDRILGGSKSSRQLGLVKIIALFAGVAVLFRLYKKMKG